MPGPYSRIGAVVLLAIAACGSDPAAGPAKTPELVVPPMPEAGAPAPALVTKKAEPETRGLSYEQALANGGAETADERRREVVPAEPDMTDAQLSGPMRNAPFVPECGAPSSMKVTVKVVVRRGRAAGVSVYTTPADPGVARCVDERVRALHWPDKHKLDTFTVTY